MHIVDFDPEVAAAHGYEIRQTPDGREYSVPVNTPANAPAPRGFDEVFGDCGSSYIDFNGTGSGTLATLATGFEVIEPAVSYGWEVDIIDSAGVSVQEWGGELPSTPTWDGFRTLDLTVGEASASVDSDFSFAVLASGAICTSGGPATTTDIF